MSVEPKRKRLASSFTYRCRKFRLPARAFVLVTFVCFASARLAWTFLVALAGLPVRASCFFGERFFLWGTARALGVLPREPAGPRFLFGFRVGMVISSCEK